MILTNFVIWSFLAGALAVLADRNITVDDFDPRIVYSGLWRHENSFVTYDRFNATTSYTFQANASASFKFNGTAVYFISYGVPPPEKDTYRVTLDGQNEVHSLRVGVNATRAGFKGFWRNRLDVSKEHTITITNLEGTIPNIDSFIITVPDNSTMKDGFAPGFEAPTTNATTSTTNDTATDEQLGRESGIPTNITVGIVAAVVGVSVGLLGALGTYLWRRRNSRNGTLKLSPNVEEGGATPFQSASSPNAPRVSPFRWAASGVPIQHGGARKEQRPSGATDRNDPGAPPPYTG